MDKRGFEFVFPEWIVSTGRSGKEIGIALLRIKATVVELSSVQNSSDRRRKFGKACCFRLVCGEIFFESGDLRLFLCAKIGMLGMNSFRGMLKQGEALEGKRRRFQLR